MSEFLAIGLTALISLGAQSSMVSLSVASDSTGQVEYLVLKDHPELKKLVKIKYQPPIFKYPPSAKINKIQGIVIVNAYVDVNGNVVRAIPVSGPEELVKVVVPYILQIEYYPLVVEGSPKPFVAEFKVPFKLLQ